MTRLWVLVLACTLSTAGCGGEKRVDSRTFRVLHELAFAEFGTLGLMFALRELALNAYSEALALDDEPAPAWRQHGSNRMVRTNDARRHWHKCSELLPFLDMFVRHVDATCAYIARELPDPRAVCPPRPVLPLTREICPDGLGTLEAAYATRAAFDANDAPLWAAHKPYFLDLAEHALIAIRKLRIPRVQVD